MVNVENTLEEQDKGINQWKKQNRKTKRQGRKYMLTQRWIKTVKNKEL